MYKILDERCSPISDEFTFVPSADSPGYASLGASPLRPNLNTKTLCNADGSGSPFEVSYLTFPHIKIPHAISTRVGGISTGAYKGLNIGFTTEDDPSAVDENRHRFAAASGVPLRAVLTMVHGVDVVVVDGPSDGLNLGDACITCRSGQPMMITTADCVPVIFYDEEHHAAGLAHAGWRGTLDRIAKVTVEALTEKFGTDPASVKAGIGPSIGPCCFEIGLDVAEKFTQSFGNHPWIEELLRQQKKSDGEVSWKGDLWLANLAALYEAGVRPENICLSRICSSCRTDLCYSYRRDKRITGRMASAILLP